VGFVLKKIDYTGPLFGPGNPFDTTGSGDIGGDSEIASSSSVLKCLDSPLLSREMGRWIWYRPEEDQSKFGDKMALGSFLHDLKLIMRRKSKKKRTNGHRKDEEV
jgi:hypothetical protein